MDTTTGNQTRDRLTRRKLIGTGGTLLLVAATTSSCDVFSTDPSSEGAANDEGGAGGNVPRESPMLTERVQAGELPPLEERLPESPLVVEPLNQPGVYGGEWRSTIQGTADYTMLVRTIGHEFLMRWDPEWTSVIPNVAESVDALDDGREYLIHLRSGLKWSDGEPFTADDIIFVYNDIVTDPDLAAAEEWLVVGDQAAPEFEKVDDLTVRIRYAEPNGLLLERFATSDSRDFMFRPRHYLQQFHKKYNPDVDDLAQQEGFSTWIELFYAKAEEWENPDMPTLNPWRILNALGDGQRVVAERNPYYWKVDPDGRQLPYIDTVVYDLIAEDQAAVLQATVGDFHTIFYGLTTLENKPVFARSRESGGYDFIDMVSVGNNYGMIALNLTHEDPALRQLFSNKDFRVGLSHAINRDELIQAVYQGQGEPWQGAPRRESELFDEELAKQYTEYDIELANEFLDRAGASERDGDGFRLLPGGERIRFQVEVTTESQSQIDAMEIVRGYWSEVGVEMRVASEDRSLFLERVTANQHDATVWGGAGGLTFDAYFSPYWYLPYGAGARYAIPWVNWFAGWDGPKEEPPEPAKAQVRLYEEFASTTDPDMRIQLFREILQIAKEQFYAIGTVLPVGEYGIVRTDLHNVPQSMLSAWQYPTPGPTNPEQYYIE